MCGGFPCQSFSIAGKRGGFADTRGTLFFEMARIAKEKHPRLLLFENVKGLLSHDNGRTFATIIQTIDELGYDLQWQVLNSKNHGVPQNRERIFIVGHLRGTPRPQVFPIGENDSVSVERQGQISPTITQRYYKQGQSDPYIVTEKPEAREQSLQQEGNKPDSSNLGRRKAYTTDIAIPVLTPDRLKKRQNGRRFKTDREPSFTLTGQDIHGVSDGLKIRRLTPTECERLQGFPDGWTEGISDTQRYKCLGNAVTTNVVEWIGKKLKVVENKV
jgi:DNA (cytosine-5)-methyltransferase 1